MAPRPPATFGTAAIVDPRTSFVGRAEERVLVTSLLRRDDVPLVTLTGPGGVGKTRLAMQVATDLAGDATFAAGVVIVPLAAVRDPRMVPFVIARIMEMPDAGNRPLMPRLQAFIGDRRVLLVLDNVEHLLAAAPLVAALLAQCPHLTVLATSRTRLSISGEFTVPLPPLSPDLAAHLFADRAQAVSPTFALTGAVADSVAAICARLDGLPLAIELAAARISVLSPASLLARLERRLELLTGGPRDAPERLRGMRAAIDWSYELLSPREQSLFRQLACFAGTFSLDAVAAVTGDADALGGLAALVDGSLIRMTERGGIEPRYTMLETIHEYALERLVASGEEPAARLRHVEWFLALAEEAELHLLREVESGWLDRLELDYDNLRAALLWTLAGDVAPEVRARGVRLAGALWLFWYYHSHLTIGRRWLERALEVASEPDAARATVLVGLGTLAHAQGDEEQSLALLSEGLALLRRLGDRWATAFALTVRGNLEEDAGRYDDARPLFEEAHALFVAADDRVNRAVTLYHLGVVAFGQGDAAQATERLSEALALSRSMNDPWGSASALAWLGSVHAARGDLEAAAAALEEALTLFRQIGSIERIADVICRIGVLAVARGELEPAARLFAAAESIGQRIGIVQALPERATYEAAIAALRRGDGEAVTAAWVEGATWSLDDAVAATAALLAPTPAPARTARDAMGLTGREVQVLRLLAEGRSDREIAEALFISRRTASTHVQHIYDKLGVASRSAAATYAVRHGLV